MKINDKISTVKCPHCSSEAFKFLENSRWMFLCHDCQRYMSFDKTGIQEETVEISSSITNFDNIMSLCIRVDSLPSNDRFRKYCESRKIPLDRVYYTNKFDKISEYAGTPVKDQERIILPFYKEDGSLFGVQGRSLEKNGLRYVTLMFDKDHPKLFGLEKVDTSKEFVIVEGPIDSMFVKNAIAMAGSDASLNKYMTNAIICLDNEPRNKQIVSKIAKYLDNGFKVVIWPENIKAKDINDMVMLGVDVDKIIHSNVYNSLTGKIKLNQWKKV